MNRPSFEEIYMKLAHELANRSTCFRLKVGCVITTVDYRSVLSVGYNGNESGGNNYCDSDEPGNCGCLHAEENAIINCNAPRYVVKHVFSTHLPCKMCVKRLVNLGGVKKIFYEHDYRLQDGLTILERAGIQCISTM